MQRSSQDGRGGRKLDEGDRSGVDVDLAILQMLIRAPSREACVLTEGVCREGRRSKPSLGGPT